MIKKLEADKKNYTLHTVAGRTQKNQPIFERIENNEVIENELEWSQKYKDQNDKEIILPSIDKFPEHFKSYISQLNQELSVTARLVVDAIRWRTNTLGPHNAVSSRGLFWSRDKNFWHPAPTSFSGRGRIFGSTVHLSKEAELDINRIVKDKLQEPVHHELFREALEQRDGNPRSSLVTGLSALEVAIKTTICNLIPKTSWLVENLPTPPITRLLNEYVPELPAVNKIDGKVIPPPKQIVKLIEKAVNIRNQIAHIGKKPPNYETLDQILEAIRDVIWLLDYYCGHEWAYNHISKETKEALKN